jgi:hypothetical protein
MCYLVYHAEEDRLDALNNGSDDCETGSNGKYILNLSLIAILTRMPPLTPFRFHHSEKEDYSDVKLDAECTELNASLLLPKKVPYAETDEAKGSAKPLPKKWKRK